MSRGGRQPKGTFHRRQTDQPKQRYSDLVRKKLQQVVAPTYTVVNTWRRGACNSDEHQDIMER